MKSNQIILLFFLGLVLTSGCNGLVKKTNENIDAKEFDARALHVAFINEFFATKRDTGNNVDSPAIWHGPDGQHWLLATAKEGNVVIVYDAASGEKITSFGNSGQQLGELSRPNGIAVIDNLAVIVERDNHRVQVFSLPSFEPIGYFGNSLLKKPYGITIDFYNDQYHLYVTDNYEMEDESIPPPDSLSQRVHYFTFSITDGMLISRHENAFGQTSGEGVLLKVETILMDRAYNRLLIADEHENQRNIKIYDLEGNFTGEIVPNDFFVYEPEGIVLWECQADSSGYYLMTDQDSHVNTFHVFDRKSLTHIGAFSGEITRNTDGVALTQQSFGSFKHGAFYPVHDDGSVTAIAWEDIAKTLGLRYDCN